MTKSEALQAMQEGKSVKTPRCPGAVLYMKNGRYLIRYHEGTVAEWIQTKQDETPDWEISS